MATPNDTTKICSRCHKELPATLEYFHKNERGQYGLHAQCKLCKNNREHERITNDDVHREAVNRKRRERRLNDSEYRQEKQRIDRERIATPHGRLRRRSDSLRRRANKLEVGGSHTAADIDLQYRSQKGKCWHCGKKLNGKFHIDHLIPLARGGSNNPDNIVCSCAYCNLSKGAKLPQEWNGRFF